MRSALPADSARQLLPFRESLLAMVGISLVNMLGALDQTVVSTALPSIVSDLKGFEYYAWIVTSYLLTSVVTVPVFGRLGDYFGRKPFVIAAVATFTAASGLCGMAHSMLFLLGARALQGIGGGMMVGTAFASIPDLFPDPHSRVKWQVVMASAYGIGTAAGPSLGGFLSEHYSWRAVFLVNLPVGLVSLACVILYLPSLRHIRIEKVRVDWEGAVLVAVALGSLQLFIELLPKRGWDLLTASLLVLVAASFACLLWWEKRVTHPIIPLDLFHDRSLNTVFLLSILTGFIMFSLIFFSPLLLQGGFGLSPQQAGLLVTPLAGSVAIGSFLNTWIVIRLTRPASTLTAGYLLLALSCLGMAVTNSHSSYWLLEAALLAGGIGMGFIFNNLNIFGQELAGRERFGITTALIQSTRMVGGMLGTALIGALVTRFYASRVPAAVSSWQRNLPTLLLSSLNDPQLLVDRHTEGRVLKQLAHLPVPFPMGGSALLHALRQVLVSSIHVGFLLTALVALVAVWKVRDILHLRFVRAQLEEAARTVA